MRKIKDVQDPNAKAVLKALADERWDFRTLDGLVQDTGLAPFVVEKVLSDYSDLIRKSAVPDQYGRALYTLRSRQQPFSEQKALVRMILSKTVK